MKIKQHLKINIVINYGQLRVGSSLDKQQRSMQKDCSAQVNSPFC